MTLIRKASAPILNLPTKSLIYGPPGVGKTTYGLTAPDPLLLDFDHGIQRVQPNERKDNVQIKDWQDVEDLLKEDLSSYGSLVIDTAGKMLDVLAADVIKTALAKSKLVWNNNLTLQGYGVLKTRFKLFLNTVMGLEKHLVFVAHDKETQDGDSTFVRPDIQGASLAILLREMDMVGYMNVSEGKTIVSFDPNEKFYGKNVCLLEKVMECRKFSINQIITQYHANQAKIAIISQQYDELMKEIQIKIDSISSPDEAKAVAEWLAKLNHVWDSKAQAGHLFKLKLGAIGYSYVKGQYVASGTSTNNQTEIPLPY